MSNTAHIFTPKDNSLAERVSAYKSVLEAYFNAEASIKFLDDDEWSDTLGERREVEQAYEVIRSSLDMAFDAIEQSELQQAKEQGFISNDELIEFMQNKRQQEIRKTRKDGDKHKLAHQFKTTK